MKTSGEGRRPSWRAWVDDHVLDPVLLVDVLQSAKTALAGVVAWVVAVRVLGLEQPFLAPWAAILVVHSTVYRSVSRGGQQVAATFLGVFFAWAAGQLFGAGAVGMGAMLAAAYLVGWHRWLREESATVAGSGIVVLATNAIAHSNLLASRMLDTTVGVVVGLLVNLLVLPPLRDRAAWSRADELPHDLADVLEAMASGLRPEIESSEVEDWIRRCGRVDTRIDEAWGLLGEARESSWWNPRRTRPEGLDRLVTVLHLLEEAVADTVSMARTVATSAEEATIWDDVFRSEWLELLGTTARAVHERDTQRLAGIHERLRELGEELSTDGLARSAWHEYGGLLVNLRNVVDALTQVVTWHNEFEASGRRSKRSGVPEVLQRVEEQWRR